MLCCGSIVAILMAMAVHRVQVKLDYVLNLLHRTRGHPVHRIGKITRRFPAFSLPMTWMVGSAIPFISSLLLLILALVTLYDRSDRIPVTVIAVIVAALLLFALLSGTADDDHMTSCPE